MVQFDTTHMSNYTNPTKVSFDFVKTPITQIADYIIISAAKSNASDIHFDPRDNEMIVRFRIDGDLRDYTSIPKSYERNMTTRLKLLANMNITESRLPQDGAIKGTFGDVYLDMRVSCLPLNEGEKIVIRILDYSRSLQGIDSLGFHPLNLKKIKRMLQIPNGIILVTGATGSGKSTTTYSMLQELNKPETNIITVEDPIEMNMEGINQVQVNSEIGMTFAAALRSILRQDPNIILIGEIRDSETAKIAVRASITGHLVLSTIHTNNSLSTIERLLDMDVERYLLSAALTGIISQRLAKQLCPRCKIQKRTTKYEKKVFKTFLGKDIDKTWAPNERGCPNCRNGYKGRLAIQEVLEIDDDIRNALNDDQLEREDLRKMVYTNKTITMLQDGLEKVLEGKTSFDEIYRVIEIELDETVEIAQPITNYTTSTSGQQQNQNMIPVSTAQQPNQYVSSVSPQTQQNQNITSVLPQTTKAQNVSLLPSQRQQNQNVVQPTPQTQDNVSIPQTQQTQNIVQNPSQQPPVQTVVQLPVTTPQPVSVTSNSSTPVIPKLDTIAASPTTGNQANINQSVQNIPSIPVVKTNK